jgi:phage major head subunit gpT-like protein
MALDTAAATVKLRGLTAKFDEGMESYVPFYPGVCSVRPSDGADEQYALLGAVPGVREWLGDRQFGKLRAADFTIKNKEWEWSLEIDRVNIEDDRLSIYGDPLAEGGIEAAAHPDQLLFELLVAGEASACFDGQYFFDTDHAWGDSGTQSNDLTYAAATGTTPTEDEFRGAYHQARAAMLGFKRDNGKPYIRPTIKPLTGLQLWVPPTMQEIATKALYKDLIASGETNIVLDKPLIIPISALTDATKFYLINPTGMMRPFVFQARRPVQRQMKGMDDRELKNVKFMTDARYNLGYGAWWNAVLTTFT